MKTRKLIAFLPLLLTSVAAFAEQAEELYPGKSIQGHAETQQVVSGAQPSNSLWGLEYQDGLIFYYDSESRTGLVSSTADQTGFKWVTKPTGLGFDVSYNADGAEWGCNGTYMGNTQNPAVGAGQANTQYMLAACPTSPAALKATGYTKGGYSWYLPSKDELGLMFNNLHKNGFGNFNVTSWKVFYWSSTQMKQANSFANAIRFWDGVYDQYTQVSHMNLRAIHSFTIAGPPIMLSTANAKVGVGENLTIIGLGFDPEPSNNVVTFAGGATSAATAYANGVLTVPVPPTAENGTYFVTSNGQKSSSSSTPLTLTPSISSFDTNPTAVSKTLTITGWNFSSTASQNTVSFGGNVTATATASTTTSLTVTVPEGAVSGNLSVTSNGLVGAASAQELNILPLPSITSFSPTKQLIGKPITINGSNFSTTLTENTVYFAGSGAAVTATPTTATANKITVEIPIGAKTSQIAVSTNNIQSKGSQQILTILSVPKNIAFTPSSQAAGLTLNITGTGFSTQAAENTVNFAGNVSATSSAATSTTLTVTVPAGAETGPISVTSVGVPSAPSVAELTILPTPTITSFNSPQKVNKVITISGTNFSTTASNNTVTFAGGVSVSPNSATATSMYVNVPENTKNGPITVTSNNIKSAPSATDFIANPIIVIKQQSQLPPAIPSNVRPQCYYEQRVNDRLTTLCFVFVYQGIHYWAFTNTNQTSVYIVGYDANSNIVSTKFVPDIRYIQFVDIDYNSSKVTFNGKKISGALTSVTYAWDDLE